MPLSLVYSRHYEISVFQHPWQVNKYKLVYDRILREGLAAENGIALAGEAADADLERVHTRAYIQNLKNGDFTMQQWLATELPYSPQVVRLFFSGAQASILAAEAALEVGGAYHIGGGFHHAFPDAGTGFCLIHDVAVAIRKLQAQKSIVRALVVDLDVHQGDGTAKIFEQDPSVFTFSIHQENNFPYPKQTSSMDIGLDDGAGDQMYLDVLKLHLPAILDDHRPDLVAYIAGADPYEKDALGGLKLTLAGLKERDRFVLSETARRKVPFFVTLAGGYAEDPADTVEIHTNTLKAAVDAAGGRY